MSSLGRVLPTVIPMNLTGNRRPVEEDNGSTPCRHQQVSGRFRSDYEKAQDVAEREIDMWLTRS